MNNLTTASGTNYTLFDMPSEPQPCYVLTDLEVFNWGPFSGPHHATIDPRGTAIIGPTGSGKTTLIDALMTLLVEQPRYNLASTGGHESDRTLISYVRGVLGGDGAEGVEAVARPANTLTGICASYSGGDEPLKLAALLWTDGSSNAAQDLKRRWIFSQAEDQSLERWLRLLHEGGSRELMKHGRNTAKLRIFDSKKGYLAHARKFFDVGNNAFTLLNRAAGLKQLNSIDEIFRELVLEDRAAFDRALEVAAEFDNLADIHKELEIAKRQQESLVPVHLENKKLGKAREKIEHWRSLRRILPVWYAITAARLWAQSLQNIVEEITLLQQTLAQQSQEKSALEARANTLREQYLQLGGNVIAELENTIDANRQRVSDIRQHADVYLRIAKQFDLSTQLSEQALQQNQARLGDQKECLQSDRDKQDLLTLDARVDLKNHSEKADTLNETLKKVKQRPGSNIPPKFQDFRSELASQLGLTDIDLPFLAELIEVKAEESPWRAAIERAIGSDRLRLLVPEVQLRDALHWINHRNNRLHVRLQAASANPGHSQFMSDGFCSKLQFKPHPLRESAKALVAGKDRHCVDSSDALRNTEHAMTIQGMMSGRSGQYEKQDQRSLQENWMTGFDNKDQLDSLTRQLIEQQHHIDQAQQLSESLQKILKQQDDQLLMIERVLELSFSTIDLPGAENTLKIAQQRLQQLLAPDSDSSRAKLAYDAAKKQFDAVEQQIRQTGEDIARRDERKKSAANQQAQCAERVGDGLADTDMAMAEQHLPIAGDIVAGQISAAEKKAAAELDEKLQQKSHKVTESERRLIALMGRAQQADTGALAETGTDLSDIPDYLERLRVLNEEALPEKTKRFLDYLNRSSDQGVTQLLSGIAEEVEGIERRIDELNETLKKVDFKAGRYLQLAPQRIKHERLRSMETAQRKLRSAALREDHGESHYRALRELVDILRQAGENRRQMGARALLDPRYRLQFYVVEVSRETGDASPPRTGSQSGSGGEKELMASHVLTASLSYALCPAHTSQPLYGTVVLDEAFSKSSPSAAGRIIEALRIFNLHPIFVTPNKEIGLLKKHTRKVICVQRPREQSSLASISWEQLDELAAAKREL